MSELIKKLSASIASESKDDRVAVLLSGGIDSLSVAIAAEQLGKRITAYSFALDGYPSAELSAAIAIARAHAWPMKVIHVPTDDLKDDFFRLALQDGCRKKVHFEVTFPISYVIPAISEAEILTGWNADDHYGNTAKVVIEFAQRNTKNADAQKLKNRFDEIRARRYGEHDAEDSTDTFWFASRIACANGKRLIDPYRSQAVREYFNAFNHAELSSPAKPLVREELSGLSPALHLIRSGIKLQKGAGVHDYFARLLADPETNPWQCKNMLHLYRRWAQQFEARTSTMVPAILSPRKAAKTEVIDHNPPPQTMAGICGVVRRDIKVISAFAGGGGSSLGYRQAGADVRAAIEFVPKAAQTYRTNFPSTHIEMRDIRDLLLPENVSGFLERAGLHIGELDILDGSPPCKNFSTAGKGLGEFGVVQSYSDRSQRNIATLPLDFARLATAIRPKILVMENVPALATRGKDVLDGVTFILAQDYFANFTVLSAADFGLAQTRRRLILIAVRKDVGRVVGIDSDERIKVVFPTPSYPGTTVRTSFAGLQQGLSDVEPWLKNAMTTSLGRAVSRLPKCPSKRLRPRHIDPNDLEKFTLTRCSWDSPAPTLTVTGQQPNSLAGAMHPEEDRKFTLPELMRLTGLPDDFILTGTLMQAVERVCRMVPPPLTRAIAERIYDRVLRPYRERVS